MTTVEAEAPDTQTGDQPEPAEAPETPGEDEEGSELDEDVSQPQEPAQPQEAVLSEKQLNAAMDKLDREAKRHRDRISEIMGEDALALVPCLLCTPELAGWRFDVPLRDEEKEVLLTIADPTRAKEYKHAENANTCPACDGLGQVVSGSLVANRELIPCSRCNGYGYVNLSATNVVPLAGPEPLGTAPVPTEAPEPLPNTDPFGRTPDDPNYGRLPQYER